MKIKQWKFDNQYWIIIEYDKFLLGSDIINGGLYWRPSSMTSLSTECTDIKYL